MPRKLDFEGREPRRSTFSVPLVDLLVTLLVIAAISFLINLFYLF